VSLALTRLWLGVETIELEVQVADPADTSEAPAVLLLTALLLDLLPAPG
jgi:hypothetical protein